MAVRPVQRPSGLATGCEAELFPRTHCLLEDAAVGMNAVCSEDVGWHTITATKVTMCTLSREPAVHSCMASTRDCSLSHVFRSLMAFVQILNGVARCEHAAEVKANLAYSGQQ